MLADHLERHREKFNSLATVWRRVGATCVQLLEEEMVIISNPDKFKGNDPALVVSSRTSTLALKIYGLEDERWKPTAEIMLDIMTGLLSTDSEFESLTAALV